MNPTRAVPAVLLAALLALTPACEQKSPAPEPKPAEPAVHVDQPKPTAEPEPDPVEVIEQGGDQLVEPEPVAPAAGGPADAAESSSPLASLPGFTPGAHPAPEPEDADPAVPGLLPTDAPVSIQVTAVDITKGTPETLEPLRAFLESDDADALDTDEVAALFELIKALQAQGVAEVVANPRVIIAAGEKAAIRVVDVGPGALPGVRQELLLQLAPTIDPPKEEGSNTLQLVRVGYDFRFNQAETPLQVVAEGLGLDIGPRARVAGAGVVQSGQTFYVVRRIVGGDSPRELLLLVRPQGMKQELNK